MRRAAWALLLGGCGPSGTYVPTPDDTDVVDTDAGSGSGADTDASAPSGTDADGDGWTVEAGDCDDADLWINPGWTEVANDNKDNDCDGRTDEVFRAVAVLDVATASGVSRVQTVDSLGDLDATLALGDAWSGYSMVEAEDGDGWVMVATNLPGVVQMHADGRVTELWNDSETEYPEGEAPFSYGGIARDPAGGYYATGGDRLWHIDAGGATEVAAWACLDGEEFVTDVCSYDLAVDPTTGTVGLFGAYGGFATWTAAGGLVVGRAEELEDPTHQFIAVEKRANGAWFALGVDAVSGAWGVFRWDAQAGAPVLKGAWPNSDYTPVDLVIEQDSGDIYVSANGGWHYTVWRMVADGSYTGMLYDSGATEPNRSFRAIGVVYDQD